LKISENKFFKIKREERNNQDVRMRPT